MSKPTRLYILIGLLGVTIAFALTQHWWLPPTESGTTEVAVKHLALTNQLALGTAAALRGPYPIELAEPIELDGVSRDDVYALRAERVERHAGLIRGPYSPEHAVYGRIMNGLPWWGTVGQFVHGPGAKSADGPAEESRFLRNPFLLVGVDFIGISIWFKPFRWGEQVTGETFAELGISPYCEPTSLVWWPDEARAEVRYPLTKWLASVSPLFDPESRNVRVFDLAPINARDMGLNFLRVAYDQSHNIVHRHRFKRPKRIRDYIHRGGSCRQREGCNNCSPFQKPFSEFLVQDVPASVQLHLWRQQPDSHDQPPDFQFTIHFD